MKKRKLILLCLACLFLATPVSAKSVWRKIGDFFKRHGSTTTTTGNPSSSSDSSSSSSARNREGWVQESSGGFYCTGNNCYIQGNEPQTPAVTDPKEALLINDLQSIAISPTATTASKYMVWVEVPVWRLKNGTKVPSKTKVQIIRGKAEELKEIFTEIYNGSEKFPIKSLSGYDWRSNGLSSLHSAGLAVDINPDENPQVKEDGTVLVGKKWEPGVNPYSITPDGDVVRAFSKRGWVWGANFRTSDYMHFGYKEGNIIF